MTCLNFHRRHGLNCDGQHPNGTYSSEPEERKKGWTRCKCPIYASGSLDRVARRLATKQRDWKAAVEMMAPFVAANSWTPVDETTRSGTLVSPVEATTVTGASASPTLDEVLAAYCISKENRGVTKATMKKYRTFRNQLLAFAAGKGVVRVAQFTITDMDAFYNGWKDGKNSKGKKLERMKGFFKFCLKRKWIAESPVEDLEPPINYTQHKQKSPFTDEEMDRIFDAASRWKPTPWHNAGEKGVVTADMVVAFVMLSVETGLRISDAATFNVRERINADTQECFLFQHKTGKPLFTWINDDLCSRLQALAVRLGPTPFITQSRDKDQAGDAWRERLAKVFFEAGPFPVHCTPHRFRHTFARILLQRGIKVEEVAELIGDTPDMVRRHYAQWATERQERLTAIMKAAYEDSLKKKWRKTAIQMPKVKQG